MSSSAVNRCVPTLENLETRFCPAHAGMHFSGGTLVISGDNQANTIQVTGDAAGSVSVTLDGGTAQTFAGVDHLVVHSGKGSDSVTLNYATGLTGRRLKLDLHTEDGDDVVKANFGALDNANVFLNGHRGKGNDAFDLGLRGGIAGTSDVRFKVDAQKGSESFTITGIGADVASTARLSFDLNSGQGTQTTNVNYTGKVEGTLNLADKAQKGANV